MAALSNRDVNFVWVVWVQIHCSFNIHILFCCSLVRLVLLLFFCKALVFLTWRNRIHEIHLSSSCRFSSLDLEVVDVVSLKLLRPHCITSKFKERKGGSGRWRKKKEAISLGGFLIRSSLSRSPSISILLWNSAAVACCLRLLIVDGSVSLLHSNLLLKNLKGLLHLNQNGSSSCETLESVWKWR